MACNGVGGSVWGGWATAFGVIEGCGTADGKGVTRGVFGDCRRGTIRGVAEVVGVGKGRALGTTSSLGSTVSAGGVGRGHEGRGTAGMSGT